LETPDKLKELEAKLQLLEAKSARLEADVEVLKNGDGLLASEAADVDATVKGR
jgi:BMFP domain-containing protein YqiC